MRALQSKLRPIRQPCLGLACACLLAAQTAVQAQPHAVEPLPSPLYAIDHETPLSASLTAGSVLSKPGPSIAISFANLGLSEDDDLNALSFNRALGIGPTQTFVLMFGVDRETIGGAPADPAFAADNRPFNVQDQAARNQEAGDLYISLDAFDFVGVVDSIGPRTLTANNTLALNQGDTGGVDQDLSPELAPAVPEESGSPDNANAAAYPPPARQGVLFYSITRDSPAPFGGADVVIDLNPEMPGQESVFASAAELGLIGQQPGPVDDIDALVVFDVDADNEFDVGLDMIFFSLDRDSPTLALRSASPADIFKSQGGGISVLYAESIMLGLDPALDNVDCLEVYPTTPATLTQDVHDWAIFRVWPGDFDSNDVLDQLDCTAFPSCYTGPGGTVAGVCAAFDIDYDTDVDCDDWYYFRSVYVEATIGDTCVLISVEDFVAALLAVPTLPEIECYADMNGDHRVDGRDIPLFVHAMIGP